MSYSVPFKLFRKVGGRRCALLLILGAFLLVQLPARSASASNKRRHTSKKSKKTKKTKGNAASQAPPVRIKLDYNRELYPLLVKALAEHLNTTRENAGYVDPRALNVNGYDMHEAYWARELLAANQPTPPRRRAQRAGSAVGKLRLMTCHTSKSPQVIRYYPGAKTGIFRVTGVVAFSERAPTNPELGIRVGLAHFAARVFEAPPNQLSAQRRKAKRTTQTVKDTHISIRETRFAQKYAVPTHKTLAIWSRGNSKYVVPKEWVTETRSAFGNAVAAHQQLVWHHRQKEKARPKRR